MAGIGLDGMVSVRHRINMIKYLALFCSLSGLVALCLLQPELERIKDIIENFPVLNGIATIGFLIMLATGAMYCWFGWCAFHYKPVPGAKDDCLPCVTVVVPAYNEGPLVLETLRSLCLGDYPVEKFQLIAIDDGSMDDTWHWIQAGEEEFPEKITAVRLMKNSGKRRALYEGFTRATGEVLVTVDSDSIVNSDTVRNLVSPFVGDPDCGAVAGNVRVLNKTGMIAKMLDVSFVFSFEFTRSAQSVLRTVLCTPGALAAYRRDLVMNVLNEWLTQKFLGREANIGEDRAITNLILRQGKSVLFQRDAVVYTSVPERYPNLCKMLIRWGRSNVRENLKMQSYAFGHFRSHHRMSARLLLIMQHLWCFPSPLLFVSMLFMAVQLPMHIVITTLAGVALWGSVPALFYSCRYGWSDALWAYAYGIFHFAALAWITPYSFLTMRRTGWLTRTLGKTKKLDTLSAGLK